MKILLVGAGGIGSRFVPLVLDHEITIMDGDIYEDRNIGRQIYSTDEVGKYKADALAQKYNQKSLTKMLSHCDDVARFDFVVCCPDNHAARALALRACDEHHIPCILAGNEVFQAQAFIYLPEWKGSGADPRVRYPEILITAREEASHSCTETVKTTEQSALANNFAASFAASLLKYWAGVINNGSAEAYAVAEKWGPIEMGWNYTSCYKLTAGESL